MEKMGQALSKDLLEKLKEAEDAFYAASKTYRQGSSQEFMQWIQFPTELEKHRPYLAAAIRLTDDLTEHEYQELTGRRGFQITRKLVEICQREHGRNLRDILPDDLEQCYRILDAAVKKYTE